MGRIKKSVENETVPCMCCTDTSGSNICPEKPIRHRNVVCVSSCSGTITVSMKEILCPMPDWIFNISKPICTAAMAKTMCGAIIIWKSTEKGEG